MQLRRDYCMTLAQKIFLWGIGKEADILDTDGLNIDFSWVQLYYLGLYWIYNYQGMYARERLRVNVAELDKYIILDTQGGH